VCVCSLSCAACNAHAPYCHLRPASLCNILPYYLKKVRFFLKKKRIIVHKICVSGFSTTSVWNIFHSKKKWARYDRKCVLVFRQRVFYSCLIVMKFEFSRQIFEKYSFTKFHENPWVGAEMFHDEANSRFSQFREKRLKSSINNVSSLSSRYNIYRSYQRTPTREEKWNCWDSVWKY